MIGFFFFRRLRVRILADDHVLMVTLLSFIVTILIVSASVSALMKTWIYVCNNSDFVNEEYRIKLRPSSDVELIMCLTQFKILSA